MSPEVKTLIENDHPRLHGMVRIGCESVDDDDDDDDDDDEADAATCVALLGLMEMSLYKAMSSKGTDMVCRM